MCVCVELRCDLFASTVQLCYCALKTAAKCNKEHLELLQRQSHSDMLRASGFDGKAVSVLSVSPEFLLSRRTAPGLPLPYEVTPSDTQECFCSPCPACLFKRQHTITILLSFSLSPLFSIPCFALPSDLFLLLQFSPPKTCPTAFCHAPSILFFILHLPLISQRLLHFFSFYLP